jgi:hypothetical protein
MSKYTFSFKVENNIETMAIFADDLMEATAQLFDLFPNALITNSERQAA